MDPLTPNKIQRLLKYAEERSFNATNVASASRRMLDIEPEKKIIDYSPVIIKGPHQESSGLLDLSHVEGIANLSLSKSTAFNPSEITGRSTGTESCSKTMPFAVAKSDLMGRQSLTLENLQSQMDKQTSEINDIMRHSIASNYSFHSKRDLTADEASLIDREAPIPVQHSTQFPDNISVNNISSLSMGAYFKHRCPDFGRILSHTDSPERVPLQPSITEVSSTVDLTDNVYKLDNTLDCVPVKESANSEVEYNANATYNKETANLKTYNPKSDVQNTKNTENVENTTPVNRLTEVISNKTVSKVLYSGLNATKVSKDSEIIKSDIRLTTEDTEDDSLSISKIKDYLGKQSNISVTDMLYLNHQKKQANKKQPLSELHMNLQDKYNVPTIQVAYLKDTKNTETASSSGTVDTVIPVNKTAPSDQQKVIPTVVITNLAKESNDEDKLSKTRSRSPSSKSQSTLSTVHENYASFKSIDSPQKQSGDSNASKYVPSPNIEYKELDKSIDWRDVIRHKHSKEASLVEEGWAEIIASPAKGFVGLPCPVILKVTTLTDSWLTAKLQFDDLPNGGRDLSIELPRQPLLLSPRKTETFTITVTSQTELTTNLNYTMFLRDASLDSDMEQKGSFSIQFNLPVVQAMSTDGINKVQLPPVLEKASVTKSLILLSDCPVDLQLALSIFEGESMFAIKCVQEIKKEEINRILTLERQGSTEEAQKPRSKNMHMQLCRLSYGNAIRVTIAFTAPTLTDLNLKETSVTMKGGLKVTLMGINTVLRKVDLFAGIGTAVLVPQTTGSVVKVGADPVTLTVKNTGSLVGSWIVKCKSLTNEKNTHFKISPHKFDVGANETLNINIAYTGQNQNTELTLIFEEQTTGQKTTIEILGCIEKPKSFPIKTNHNALSWVRPGRKEISLKNCSDKKIHIRCHLSGEGFCLDMPGMESRGVYALSFMPNECRALPVVFAPNNAMPHLATLFLAFDKTSDISRKVKLYGCASGCEAIRWHGLVTYGNTALLRAITRTPIELKLANKSTLPAFVYATVHFNLQYMCIQETASITGGRHIIPGRSQHSIALKVDWNKVERRARESGSAALATVTALTGSDITRRRILRILKKDSTGELDLSMLPDHLKVLANTFEGDDSSHDTYLENFNEPKTSLNELIGGLQELNAQIDLPLDFADDNTIIINDDTLVEHHTFEVND